MIWALFFSKYGFKRFLADFAKIVSKGLTFQWHLCRHCGRPFIGIMPSIAAMAAVIWLAGYMRVEAQGPVWQQCPPSEPSCPCASGADSVSGPCCSRSPGGNCDNSCALCEPCCNGNDVGCSCNSGCLPPCGISDLLQGVWVRADALLWWTNGGNIPPLLTTSPLGTSQPQAGVLGQPGTEILLGNQEVNNAFRGGGRISFGTWLGDCESGGIEFTYLALGRSVDGLTVNSSENPILARPFFNVDDGAEDAHLIAYPGLSQGTFSFTSTSSFQVAEVLARRALVQTCGGRIDLLGGYRFQHLAEGLDITDTATAISSNESIQIFDEFHTRNDFNGGEVGIDIQRHSCHWSLETILKLALGNSHSRIDITGSTTTPTNVFSGGLLALPSNMGPHEANQFSIIPELGFTLGCDLTCNLRATLGYTFMYWSNVPRPGDQIDLNVSPSQFPPSTATVDRPAFVQHNSDFWAQGINLGLDYRF